MKIIELYKNYRIKRYKKWYFNKMKPSQNVTNKIMFRKLKNWLYSKWVPCECGDEKWYCYEHGLQPCQYQKCPTCE